MFETRRFWIRFSLVEFMVIGLLVSFIENFASRIVEAPTIGVTMFLVGVVLLMFLAAKN